MTIKKVIQYFYPSRSIFISLILISLLYITTLFVNNPRGFWITDDATKFLQVKAILNSRYTDFSLPWPGTTIDPDFEYNPIPTPFSKVSNHKLYSIFCPVFATISTIPFKYFGFPGLYILPLIASLLMLIGIAKIAKIITSEIQISHYSLLLTGLCTPVWFYSVVFWEHSIGVSLCIWAIYFYLSFIKNKDVKYLILGNMFAAFGVYFRDDLYLFCAVLLITMLIFVRQYKLRNLIISLGTLGISILPLWLFQWIAIGTPFGYHLSTHFLFSSGIIEHLSSRFSVFYNMLIASNPRRWLSFLLAAPFIISFLLYPRASPKIFNYIIPVYGFIAFACGLIYLGGLFQANSSIAFLLQSSNSFFVTAPIILLAFLRPKFYNNTSVDSIGIRWIWLVSLLYVVFYCLFAPQLGSNGIHWGNRFLLVVYPLLIILSVINTVQWFNLTKKTFNWQVLIVALVVVISLVAQIKSIDILHKKKEFSYRLNHVVANKVHQIPMITYLRWVPSDLEEVFFQKMIFLPRSQQQMYDLLKKLAEKGYNQFIFINNKSSKETYPPFVEVDDNGLNFFSLKFTLYNNPFIKRE